MTFPETGASPSTPKHARTQYDALAERRSTSPFACPGRHCAGGVHRTNHPGVVHLNMLGGPR